MSARILIQATLLFIGLLLGQIFVFDLIHITGFGSVMVYPLLIMLLPINLPKAAVLVIAFLVGYILDFFTGNGGFHAAALTLMAFARGPVLDLLAPTAGYDKNALPTVEERGVKWFLLYAFLLLLVHQTAYYFIERFSFSNFMYTVIRIISGTAISVFTIWLLTLLFSATERKRKSRT